MLSSTMVFFVHLGHPLHKTPRSWEGVKIRTPSIKKDRVCVYMDTMLSETSSPSNDSPIIQKEVRIPNSVEPSSIGNKNTQNQCNRGAEWKHPIKSFAKQAGEMDAVHPDSNIFYYSKNNSDMEKKEEEDDCFDVPDLIAEDSVDAYENFNFEIAQRPSSMAFPSLNSSPALESCFTLPKAPTDASDMKPTTSASPALTSCLKKTKANKPLLAGSPNIHPTTQRRVRGLWNTTPSRANSSRFEQLREDTILHCFSFLESNPSDLLSISQVGRRFHYIITASPQLWKRIDATDFVQGIYQRSNQSNKQTTQALGRLLLTYTPESLTIRNIGNKLRADESFLPPGGGRLKELNLTQFDQLTDTHMHVMLLLMALSPQQQQQPQNKKILKASVSLQHLALEDCPQLTNATVRSIASSVCCANLESLSLRGNPQVNDVLPLAPLLKTQARTRLPAPSPRQGARTGFSPLAGLFGSTPSLQPQTPATPALSPSSVTPPNTKTSTSTLESLFAPPGTSPTRSPFTKSSSVASANSTSHPMFPTLRDSGGGSLQRLDLRGTGVSPKAWIECCRRVASSRLILLRSFAMDGNGWSNQDVEELTKLLALRDLQTCHLPVVDAPNHGSLLTLGGASPLQFLHLAGEDTSCIVPGRNIFSFSL